MASGPSPRLISYNGTNFADLSSNVTGLGDIFSVADNGSTWLIGGGWSGQPSTLYSLFSVTNPAPTLTYLGPNSAAAGSPAVHLNIMGTNFIPSSQVQWNGTALSTDYVDGTHIHATVPAADLVNPGAFAVTVFNPPPGGGASSPMTFTVSKSGPDLSTWYLAEGTNAWGFSTYITIENPNDHGRHRQAHLHGPQRAGTRQGDSAPPGPSPCPALPDHGLLDVRHREHRLLHQGGVPAGQDHSRGPHHVLDRAGLLTRPARLPLLHRGHLPSKTWYLPEGSSAWGFETWTLVENPNASPAHVTLTYMTQDRGPRSLPRPCPPTPAPPTTWPPTSGQADASIKVTSDVPVVAERSMYRNNRREGSCSIGATTPATDYYLAEGATG